MYGDIAHTDTPTESVRSQVASDLKRLRKRAGLSVREVASALDKPISTYYSYEDKYKKRYLPLDLIEQLIPVFEPRGVHRSELLQLAGVNNVDMGGQGDVRQRRWTDRAAAKPVAILEVDLRQTGNGDPISDVERPVAVWQVPREVLAPVTMAAADRIRIITTIGDSMEPSIPAGSKLMVDTSDCMPSPPGIFVVFDGIGLVVKRVEYVPHSEPARVRLWSDNPAYESYERPLTDANIRGRVIGRWRWM